jgi:pimeloyl-ACP methyl ester carboxylesterase
MIEPVFFRGAGNARLCGVWRVPFADGSTPGAGPARVWVVCAPFAEEEKSAHRTLVELADALVSKGDAVLFFAYRGTGDSDGEFANATLTAWSEDILDAVQFACKTFPQSTPGLIGLRLGASLAAQVGEHLNIRNFILMEPVLRGRSFLMQLGARQKIRAALTEQEAGENSLSENLSAKNSTAQNNNSQFEDMDGWPLGAAMREELHALDLSAHPPRLNASPAPGVLLLQIGPRDKIASSLEQFAGALDTAAKVRAVVMPPFWNRLDYVSPAPLLKAVTEFEFQSELPGNNGCEPQAVQCADENTRAFTLKSGAETMVAVATSRAAPRAARLLFLHGWTGYRTGPHQMLSRAARYFQEREYSGLRFDFVGRGDSSGDAALATLATMADDARVAIRHLREQDGEAKIILVGLCSGCEVAFAVADEPGVAGLALWSAPVFAAGQSSERIAKKRAGHLKDYARKLLRPTTWGKVLSGKVDVKGVQKVVGQGGGEEFKNEESDQAGRLPVGWRADAMQRFENVRLPSLLIYGTADPTTNEALAWHRGQLRVAPHVHLVEGANHSYYGIHWEMEVFRVTEQWLGHF